MADVCAESNNPDGLYINPGPLWESGHLVRLPSLTRATHAPLDRCKCSEAAIDLALFLVRAGHA
jgi:hypothetical protein